MKIIILKTSIFTVEFDDYKMVPVSPHVDKLEPLVVKREFKAGEVLRAVKKIWISN